MSAGWPQDDPWADRQLYRDDASMTGLYQEGVTFSNPPGITFEYSNYAYFVLGRIVSCVSGEPAIEYIERVLLKPLGMDSTSWQPDAIPDSNRAQGYRWEDEQWREEQPLASGSDVAAFAGLCSTIHDLAHWIGFLLSAWAATRRARHRTIVTRHPARDAADGVCVHTEPESSADWGATENFRRRIWIWSCVPA